MELLTKVDFYLIQGNDTSKRHHFACRLVDKAYQLGRQVHIHTDAAHIASQLDDLLWSFHDRSFIPHEIEPQNQAQIRVTIGYGWVPNQCDVLINLATDIPEFFSRFKRIAEIIDQNEDRRELGRTHYRHYRDHGCTLTHHELKS